MGRLVLHYEHIHSPRETSSEWPSDGNSPITSVFLSGGAACSWRICSLSSMSAQGPSNTHCHPLHECVKLQAAHVSERQKEILSRKSTRRGKKCGHHSPIEGIQTHIIRKAVKEMREGEMKCLLQFGSVFFVSPSAS